jgi:dCMP deaminase
MKNQLSWDRFYLDIANKVSELSYANDRKVGCVIVRNGNILSFSYNGTPPGFPNETECNGVTLPTVYHAEEAAILKMAREGISTSDTTIYCTLSPCLHCAKIIVQAGVKRLVYRDKYKDDTGINFLLSNGVSTHSINEVNQINEHCNLIPVDQLRHTGLL